MHIASNLNTSLFSAIIRILFHIRTVYQALNPDIFVFLQGRPARLPFVTWAPHAIYVDKSISSESVPLRNATSKYDPMNTYRLRRDLQNISESEDMTETTSMLLTKWTCCFERTSWLSLRGQEVTLVAVGIKRYYFKNT